MTISSSSSSFVSHVKRKSLKQAPPKIPASACRFYQSVHRRRSDDALKRVLIFVDELLAQATLPVLIPRRSFINFCFSE
jgi:hypothetical protein